METVWKYEVKNQSMFCIYLFFPCIGRFIDFIINVINHVRALFPPSSSSSFEMRSHCVAQTTLALLSCISLWVHGIVPGSSL